jgi:hypothetical protein
LSSGRAGRKALTFVKDLDSCLQVTFVILGG